MKFKIIRFYFEGSKKRVIERGLTLEQVQKHCADPETSSSTCKGKLGKARTKRVGTWFDGYAEN